MSLQNFRYTLLLEVLLTIVISFGIIAFLFSLQTVSSAVPTGSYIFSPSTGTFPGCEPRTAQVVIKLPEGRSTAADLFVYYDPAKISVLSVDPGDAYEIHGVNRHDPITGEIVVNGLTVVGEGFSGEATFLSILFASKPGTNTATFDIYFTGVGDTIDSNIADSESSLDVLQQVVDATYGFSNPNCIEEPNNQPTQPTNPTVPSNPSTPSTPDNPSQPTQPDQPEDLDQSPNQDSQPSSPDSEPDRLESLNYQVYVEGQYYLPNQIPNVLQGDLIEISGMTSPNRRVQVVIQSDPLVFDTRSDENGDWSVIVNTNQLPLGVHSIQVFTLDDSNQIILSTELAGLVIVERAQDVGAVLNPDFQLATTAEADRAVAIMLAVAGVVFIIFGILMSVEVKQSKLD